MIASLLSVCLCNYMRKARALVSVFPVSVLIATIAGTETFLHQPQLVAWPTLLHEFIVQSICLCITAAALQTANCDDVHTTQA